MRPLAELVIEELTSAAGSRKRLLASECDEALLEVRPGLETDPERRALLAELLAEMRDSGEMVWSKKLDRRVKPELPAFVILTNARPTEPPAGSGFPWRPELAWAHEMRLTPSEFDVLKAIQAFVRDRPEAPIVPHRERSLEVFRDEKRLDRLVRSRFFDEGRLTMSLLRTEWVPPPISLSPLGTGTTVLVSENAAGFHSLASASGGKLLAVAYGAGTSFAQSVAGIAAAGHVERILYIGDLDAEGVMIPQRALAVARRIGLPDPEPALGLWRALCDESDRFGHQVQPVPTDVSAELCAWFGDTDVAKDVQRLLEAGVRVAQEVLGVEWLAARSWSPEMLAGGPAVPTTER